MCGGGDVWLQRSHSVSLCLCLRSTAQIITLNLNSAGLSTVVRTALCIGLYLTYPIMMHPVRRRWPCLSFALLFFVDRALTSLGRKHAAQVNTILETSIFGESAVTSNSAS